MKLPLTITLCLSLLSTTLFAQLSEAEKNLAEAINVSAGGTFGKPKILPKADKLAIVQVSVDFKQMTTKSVQKTEKKQGFFGKTPGKSATASVTAYLETTDGELGAADYNEITHHFYYYFQKKLKEAGIDTIGWSSVSSTEFYKENEKEKAESNQEEKSKGNSWVTYNAFNGGTMYNGNGGFAFLKLKKVSKMCDDLGAPVVFVCATVDFADLDVAVDVKTSGYKSTWTPNSSQTTTMKSETKVKAFMKIPSLTERLQYSYVVNDKNGAENVNVTNELPAEMNYATELTEDPSRAKKRSEFFAVSLSKKMESDPVVISATRENYKAAAKKALEKYADAFVAKMKQMKKD